MNTTRLSSTFDVTQELLCVTTTKGAIIAMQAVADEYPELVRKSKAELVKEEKRLEDRQAELLGILHGRIGRW